MANDNMGIRDRDLVLAPGEFAFVLDTTKGLVNTVVGPNKTSMSNTDQPVVWDTQKKRFKRVDTDQAIQTNPIAPEGFYIVLFNPAETAMSGQPLHPREGASSVSVPLQVGHRVNIPGPVHFPLWPGQMANVIQGHHLRSNQYLLAQVYNDAEATANWQKAVLKPQEGTTETAVPVVPQSFTPGQLIIIRGTDVAFFIPPTGIKVVPESDKVYVREAVTLERLEYCILLDEDGNKRFVQGPDVVFPEPTEKFVEKDGQRKFRAIELNETTGIYVKVIADYDETVDGQVVHHKAGDELFITGKEQAIYFQREEHSVIRYGDQTKHYAVAVPAGEGRYVLNRTTGVVSLVRGPRMLLCDPRYEVIVRRVLSPTTAALWYPGNERVVQMNKELAAIEDASMPMASPSQYEPGRVRSSSLLAMNYSDEQALKASRQIAGDTFARGNKFTPPRTIVLDTKYEGAVSVSVWTGYAVLVINKTGQRRVVVGPETILLEYDETLAPLELSTGRPKDDTKPFRTVYLRVKNNKVTDKIRVESKDLVTVDITVAYRVNFDGDDPEKWFAVENYVALLCDHMRSLIRNAAKRTGIEEFYGNTVSVVRDTVLGVSPSAGVARPGRQFDENNMHVYDVEILEVAIADPKVASLLSGVQLKALQSAIQITEQERELETTRRSEEIRKLTADIKADSTSKVAEATKIELMATLEVSMEKIRVESATAAEKLRGQVEREETMQKLTEAELQRSRATDDERLRVREAEITLDLRRLLGETEEIVKRATAVDDKLAVALTTFSDQALVEKISSTLGPMAAMSGISAADILSNLFKGTPFGGVMDQLGKRSRIPVEIP